MLELERQLEQFQAETRKKEAEMAILQQQYHEMKLIEQKQKHLRLQKHALAAQPVVVPVVVTKQQDVRMNDLDIDPRSMQSFRPADFRGTANNISTSRMSGHDVPTFLPTEHQFEVEYDHTELSAAETALINKATVWAALHDEEDSAPAFLPQHESTSQSNTLRQAPRPLPSPRSWQPVSYEDRSEVLKCLAQKCHAALLTLTDGALSS